MNIFISLANKTEIVSILSSQNFWNILFSNKGESKHEVQVWTQDVEYLLCMCEELDLISDYTSSTPQQQE